MSARTIHKVQLDRGEYNGRRITGRVERWLAVQWQDGRITIWYEVDLASPDVITKAVFQIVGTGHPLPADDSEYLGTVQDGAFVWHVFLVDDPCTYDAEGDGAS